MLKWFGVPSGDKPLPPDKLQVQHLVAGRQVFTAESGVPSTADSLAYDPVQRLLAVSFIAESTDTAACSSQAPKRLQPSVPYSNCVKLCCERLGTVLGLQPQVGTEDGRVKVVGTDGVEILLCSTSTDAGTQQLLFLANRGGIVRLDQVTADSMSIVCTKHSNQSPETAARLSQQLQQHQRQLHS